VRWPLVTAGVTGWLRQGLWALLVLAVFTVAALAAASAPMFDEASDNAVLANRRATVPPTASLNDDAAVRLTASISPRSSEQAIAVRELGGVAHLSAPTLGGASVGAEVVRPRRWVSTVTAGGRTGVARLLAAEDPAARLVPVGGTPGTGGVWLPEPLAADLGVRAGDTFTYRIETTPAAPPGVLVTVAGVYAVTGSRVPADPPGTQLSWARQQGDFPVDTSASTLKAHLLIGDIASIERLAEASGDRMLWWADAVLEPGTTLAQARETARAVADLRSRYLGRISTDPNASVTPRLASGVAQVVVDAARTADTVQRRTRVAGWAALAIALASVLAVGLLAVRRRRMELRHSVGVGLSPSTVGTLWFLEHLVPAVPAAAAGWALAWLLVGRFGPPGDVTATSLRPALVAAALAALAGPVTVAVVAALSAARRVRPAVPMAPRRPRPWGLLVIVAAAVAAVGLWSTTQARGVDLVVPLLVLAAVGVAGGTLIVRIASLRRKTTADAERPAVVWWLLRRRLAAGGERVLTVTLLTTGLGMLAFTLSAVNTVEVNIDDRVAAAAGAAAVATIDGSWELDDKAVLQPPAPKPEDGPPPQGLVPGVRTPPLPAHTTLVWRLDAYTPYDEGLRDLVIVEPQALLPVAEWGRGSDLAAARRAVEELGRPSSGPAIPAIVIGDPSVARLDEFPVVLPTWDGRLRVIAHLPAFPGMGNRSMYVVPGAAMFPVLGREDPRLRPSDGFNPGFVRTELWSSKGALGLDEVVKPRGVGVGGTTTIERYRQDPLYIAAGQSRGYELAVAAYLALLAVVALALHADRTAVAARPGDLMLARVGVGRTRIVGARAAELVALVAVAALCALGGLAGLAPLAARLLDPNPGQVPELRLAVPPAAIVVSAGVAVVAAVLAAVLAVVRSSAREEDAFRGDG
jgi:putative ABC transport system permease protein